MILDYYKKVLGLRFLPRPMGVVTRLYVIDLPSVPNGLSANPLFPKMMAAMGLKKEEVHVIEFVPSEAEQHIDILKSGLPILSFSQELADAVRNFRSFKYLLTVDGPRDLDRDPLLKKKTWTGLQSLIQELSRSSKSP